MDGRLCVGDIILQIDRQDVSQMTLAQATLALSSTSPLLRLSVYRPGLEESEWRGREGEEGGFICFAVGLRLIHVHCI